MAITLVKISTSGPGKREFRRAYASYSRSNGAVGFGPCKFVYYNLEDSQKKDIMRSVNGLSSKIGGVSVKVTFSLLFSSY